MASTGELEADPLFVGLTRPPMLFGVSYIFVLLNGFFSILGFINTSDFTILLVIAPSVHLVGYLICFKEPLFLELYMIRSNKCMKCKNRFYHGANSYDLY